jgi:peptide/nickel transport system substrate-binding protein
MLIETRRRVNMKKMSPRQLSLVSLLVVVMLIVAACGGSSGGGPAATSAPAGSAAEAQPTEAATPETAAAAQPSPTPDTSGAALATELKAGATIVTNEPDVSAPRTHYGGEYHDVSTSDAVSFHPYQTTDTASSAYQGLVYSGSLLKLNEKTLEYEPYAAESYSISEDGLTFTFKLRKDLKWSDGQPLTAQDYKWTYDQVTDPKNEFPYLSQFDFITSYEALDDYTIQIKIKEVYAPALGQVDFITPLPKHIWEKLPWGDPEKNPEIMSPSVVSGPYKLVEWKRDQYAIFEANDNYWYHGAPNISRYTIEIVPDQDVAYEKMRTGESDTAPITPEKLKEARQLPNVTVYEWWPAAARWSYIGLNMREGFPTHDINVRHGLNYAIDKELLTDQVMLGQAKRLCSVYPETSWAYTPDVPCYKYDPEQAKAEFAKAGYTFQNGQMVDKDGKQLELKLIYGPNTSQTLELMAVTIQDYLSRIGIKVNIQAMEWASFLEAEQAKEPDWDMYLGAWRATIEPHIMFTIFSEANIPDLNSVAYVNKDVEALFKEAGATYDTEFRKGKYQQIQKILAEDSPYIFLFYQKAWSGQNNRIKGIEPTALGIGWNQEDWYIEQTPQ